MRSPPGTEPADRIAPVHGAYGQHIVEVGRAVVTIDAMCAAISDRGDG